MVALIYNWWSLFVRLADPQHHREAITSRPLLLSAIARRDLWVNVSKDMPKKGRGASGEPDRLSLPTKLETCDLSKDGLFNAESADILGIPFDFTAKPVVVKPTKPAETVRVQAVRAREALEITFPRASGYRVALPNERLRATFGPDSVLELTPLLVGPCGVPPEGIVGEGVILDVKHLDKVRPSTVAYNLAKEAARGRCRTAAGSYQPHRVRRQRLA
jgi:hypothetical protein